MDLVDGSPILYMKVGTHARESLPDIIRRKRLEIESAGFTMWGYGGNTCHPTSMVQPFARAAIGPVLLCMKPMNSTHFAEPLRAEEFSSDGITWKEVPESIDVRGSRYALCISSLDEVDIALDLATTEVAVGNSKGRPGDQYIKGRVDKACLEIHRQLARAPEVVDIKLVAEVIDPYAVFLRG